MLRMNAKHRKQMGLDEPEEQRVMYREGVDCRECLHMPVCNTTGIVADMVRITDTWTRGPCGYGLCEGKEFQKVGAPMSVIAPGDEDDSVRGDDEKTPKEDSDNGQRQVKRK